MDLSTLTAEEFRRVWDHYDADGNGFIEGSELDLFLKEFINSVSSPEDAVELSESELASLKKSFLSAYDRNKDGRIDITELAQLLPMDENFLLLFRFDNPLESSVEFMQIWNEYDKDSSGYLDANELKEFVKDLLTVSHKQQAQEKKKEKAIMVAETESTTDDNLDKEQPVEEEKVVEEVDGKEEVTVEKLAEYTQTMLTIFDWNKDGKLQLSEMARLLPVKENFLNHQILKGSQRLTREDIESVFCVYDRDESGFIDNDELAGFLKDLLELTKKDYECSDLEDFHASIMRSCDTNRDGRISLKELTMVLLALSQV